jgi:hypothetical protein
MGKFQNALWLPIGLYLAAVILLAWNPTPFAQGLAAIAICTAYAHACITYGWRDGTVFALICLVVSLTVENIGLTTGLMFGHYHFTVGANLPHIGAAPLIVGPLWFGMGYFSWVTAATILRRPGLFSLPALAACVMTSWDLVMEPRRGKRLMGPDPSDGPAGLHHFKSLDLVRWRRGFRRAALQLCRLAVHGRAVLHALCPSPARCRPAAHAGHDP